MNIYFMNIYINGTGQLKNTGKKPKNTKFPLTKLFGKLRKKDETRLRLTSPVASTVDGVVDVGEERVGWTFLSFPNANTKKFQDDGMNRIDRILK